MLLRRYVLRWYGINMICYSEEKLLRWYIIQLIGYSDDVVLR